MNLSFHRFDLPLRHVFTISRGSSRTSPTLIVELQQDGKRGFGEAGESDFYGAGAGPDDRRPGAGPAAVGGARLGDPAELWQQLSPVLSADSFAQCALDLAAHDLWGKLRGEPVWKLWGLRLENLPATDYTIGIDTIDVMVRKMQEFPGWPIYKIKLGTPDDLGIVRELRKHTDAVFRVDANCAWGVEETLRNAAALKQLGVEFIEQPLPPDRWDDMKRVFAESALPVIADESCQREPDVDRCAGSLPRHQREARQVRRPDAGPAHDRPRPRAGAEDHGRLHDGVHGGDFGDRPACADAGLRGHGRGALVGRGHRHRRAS